MSTTLNCLQFESDCFYLFRQQTQTLSKVGIILHEFKDTLQLTRAQRLGWCFTGIFSLDFGKGIEGDIRSLILSTKDTLNRSSCWVYVEEELYIWQKIFIVIDVLPKVILQFFFQIVQIPQFVLRNSKKVWLQLINVPKLPRQFAAILIPDILEEDIGNKQAFFAYLNLLQTNILGHWQAVSLARGIYPIDGEDKIAQIQLNVHDFYLDHDIKLYEDSDCLQLRIEISYDLQTVFLNLELEVE